VTHAAPEAHSTGLGEMAGEASSTFKTASESEPWMSEPDVEPGCEVHHK
jgi:hypothetical protein